MCVCGRGGGCSKDQQAQVLSLCCWVCVVYLVIDAIPFSQGGQTARTVYDYQAGVLVSLYSVHVQCMMVCGK